MSTKEPGLSPTDLEKGIAKLTAAAASPSRQQELFQKAQAGSITDTERDELVKSLSGGDLASSVAATMASENMQKSLEVSDYLREFHDGNVSVLTRLAETIEKSEGREQEFRVAMAQTVVSLAKSVQANGAALGAIADKLGIIAAQPARAPRAAQRPGTIEKSFGGQGPGQSDQLSKSAILDAMEEMVKGAEVVAGEDMVKAAAKYESTNMITPEMLAEVRKHISAKSRAA